MLLLLCHVINIALGFTVLTGSARTLCPLFRTHCIDEVKIVEGVSLMNEAMSVPFHGWKGRERLQELSGKKWVLIMDLRYYSLPKSPARIKGPGPQLRWRNVKVSGSMCELSLFLRPQTIDVSSCFSLFGVLLQSQRPCKSTTTGGEAVCCLDIRRPEQWGNGSCIYSLSDMFSDGDDNFDSSSPNTEIIQGRRSSINRRGWQWWLRRILVDSRPYGVDAANKLTSFPPPCPE